MGHIMRVLLVVFLLKCTVGFFFGGGSGGSSEETCELTCSPDEAITLNFIGDTQLIESPGYSDGYCASMTCGWSVNGPPGSTINIIWNDFHIEAWSGWLNGYDGPDSGSPELFQCTTSCLSHNTTSKQLHISLTTVSSGSPGFEGIVIAMQAPTTILVNTTTTIPTTSTTTTVPPTTTMNTTTTEGPCAMACTTYPEHVTLNAIGESQLIQSPFYPDNYCPSSVCTWQVTGPPDSIVQITWDHMHLDENDFVRALFMGDNKKGLLDLINCYGTTCESDTGTSRNHQMAIYFRSADDNTQTGSFSSTVRALKSTKTVTMKPTESESTTSAATQQDCTERVFLFGGDELLSQGVLESFCPADQEHRIENYLNLGTKGPVAGLLDRNKILVAGGKTADDVSVAWAVLYDPISKTLTKVEDMLHPRVYAAGVVLEGIFYVCGGYDSHIKKPLKYCEKFSDNTWSPIASLQMERYVYVMAELNGVIYVIGGNNGDDDQSSVESYNPSNGTWSYEQPFPGEVSRASGATFDNHIFICGGFIHKSWLDKGSTNDCYKYSDITKKWTEASAMTNEKSYHSMVVADGTMFVFYKYDIEMFDNHTDTWQLLDTESNNYRRYSAAVTVPASDQNEGNTQLVSGSYIQFAEHVLLFGGTYASSKQNIESYYPGDVALNDVHDLFYEDRGSPIAMVLDHKILMAGGRAFSDGDAYKSTVLYEPFAKEFTKAEDMVDARHSAAATVFNNTILVCGGANEDDGILGSCEKYVHSAWIPMAHMLTARKLFAMVELNGLVYAIGGYDGEHLSSVESYYPKSDKWSSEPPLPGRFCYPQAVAFDNRIYLCGGKKDGTTTNECYKYSDIMRKWIPAPSLYKKQSGHSMVVAHGTMYSFYKFGVEMYNKSLEKWIPIPSDLLFYRKHFSAVAFMDNY